VTPRAAPAAAAAPRDDAIDVARALAILGMFVVHAALVLGATVPETGVAGAVLWLCDGRAAAMFLTLAGVGVARVAERRSALERRTFLWRRALALWTLGVVNFAIWPGDILRLYGVALLLAPWIVQARPATRLAWVGALTLLFPVCAWLLDWTRHWELDTLTYVGAWTPTGFVRNLLIDGFRPAVPWLAFFIAGTVVGARDLRAPALGLRLLVVGVVATCGAVALSVALDAPLARLAPDLDAATRAAVRGTSSLPPFPLFVVSALGTTAIALGAVIVLLPQLPAPVRSALVATGRRSLTWYLLHIAVLVAAAALRLGGRLPAGATLAVGPALFAVAVAWSYRHRAVPGRIERLFRTVTAPGARRQPDA
jgi:uncharacterized membrane protein YeiB